MSLPASDIIGFVRRKLHEPDESDSRFADNEEPGGRPDLVGMINDVRADVCERIHYCRKALRYEGTGATNYPLPEDLLSIEQVTSLGVALDGLTIRDSAPYSPLEPLQANLFAGGYGYLVKGDQIFFLPILQSGEQRVLHYIGVEAPVLTAQSTLRAPRSLRDVYGYAVLAHCYETMRDSFWADRMQAKFENLCRRRAGAEKRRQYPGNRQMRVPRR